jgi:hypothetical protein
MVTYNKKTPRRCGLRVGVFRVNRTDPQGLPWAIIITMPPTTPVLITNGLVRTANMGGRFKGSTIYYLRKDSGPFGPSQVAAGEAAAAAGTLP